MVRQWQEMFYAERYSEVYLSPDCPTTVGWPSHGVREASGSSRPRGGPGHRPRPTTSTTAPVVIDFRTDAFEKVFPWLPPAT